MRGFAQSTLVLAACAACLHARGAIPAEEPLLKLPILVAQDVLVNRPAIFPRAQPLREALVALLLREGFCLDRRGDFEAFLQLRVDYVPASRDSEGALTLTLTLDKATGVRIDEMQEQLEGGRVPSSRLEAERMVRPLVDELEDSRAAHELAESSAGCADCCAAR